MEMEKLKQIIAEVLSIDLQEIDEEMSFVDDLGADSLEIYQIIMGIEEEFDIEIEEEAVGSIVTVGQVYDVIRSCTGE